jgi:hypothetical protein
MQLPKLAIALTASLLFGCTSQSPQPQTQSSPTLAEIIPTPNATTTTLQRAVQELQILEAKVKAGIDDRAYSVIVADTLPLVQKATGDPKAVARIKSAFEGHQLALKFWQCDRLNGYEELHQCRGKILSGIFAKYPDIAAQAKKGVGSQDLSTISNRLDKEALLKRIWQKTSVDTVAAGQAISLDTSQNPPQS